MAEILLWTSEDIESEDIVDIVEDSLIHLVDILREELGEIENLYIGAKNINWQGDSGYKIVDMRQYDLDIARQIIPTYDNSFTLYKEDGELYAIVSSHDVPTGSTWYFKEVTDEEMEKEDLYYS